MRITYQTTSQNHIEITDWVLEQKHINPNYRVIDIGGSKYNWTSKFVDLTVDINADSDDTNIKIDVCNESEWKILFDYVEQHGKFDYAICTHTLEDLYNPITTLNLLPRIAEQGVITMPSIRTELARIENRAWLGFIHHRWIFDQQNGYMLIAPKLTWLENELRQGLPVIYEDIAYHWTSKIDYKILMNNYLGPTAGHVVDEYRKMIKNIDLLRSSEATR